MLTLPLGNQNGTVGWKPSEGYFDPHVVLAATCAMVMLAGLGLGQPLLIGAGAAGLCAASRNIEQLTAAARESKLADLAAKLLNGCGAYTIDGDRQVAAFSPAPSKAAVEPKAQNTSAEVSTSPSGPTGDAPDDEQPENDGETAIALFNSMVESGRYALLLRPETVGHLDQAQHLQAVRRLDEDMALVPAGSVLIGMAAERATLDQASQELIAEGLLEDSVIRVEPCYLDRRAVTNADYLHFVEAGGYEQLEFWPEEALPALFDFIDSTGVPGPRYWADGRFSPGDERLPVVGVSWYEATAYARWVGKRLPRDAEWTKACAWPIEAAPGRIAQRRYPWGETFDARRANLWSATVGGLVEVDEFSEGITVGGIEQMVGNIWEWTCDTLDDATPRSIRFPTALRSVRGGAYNTYFENQATCHYQSGEQPLARRGNIGIRLALDMVGLASPSPATGPATSPATPDADGFDFV